MKVWIVQAGGRYDGVEIARERTADGFRPLVFADTAEGYDAALTAFRALVRERLNLVLSYSGEFGTDARAHIVARDGEDSDWNDTVELVPFEVIGG